MTLRRKHVRRALGVVLVAGLGYVTWLLMGLDRHGPVVLEPVPPEPGTIPDKPQQEAGCAEPFVLDLPKGALRRLEAGVACRQPDGSSRLDGGVTLTVRRDAGGEFVVKADRGRLPEDPDAAIELEGRIEVASEDGFRMTGSRMDLDREAKRIVAPEPVEFAWRDMTGSAGRLDHDWEGGRTLLTVAPVITVTGGSPGAGTATLRGESIHFLDERRLAEVRGGGRIDFEGGHVQAASLDVTLAPDVDEVRRIDAVGSAETRTSQDPAASAGPAMARTLLAERIVHELGPGGRLDLVKAENGARLSGVPADGSQSRKEQIDAASIVLGFVGGGEGAGPVRLDGLAARGAPAVLRVEEGAAAQDVSAAEIDAAFHASGDLDVLEARGGAELAQSASGSRGRLTADTARLTFRAGAGYGGVERLEFTGGPARLDQERPTADGPSKQWVVAREGDVTLGPDGEARSGSLEGSVKVGRGTSVAAGDEAVLSEDGKRTTFRGHASVESEGRVAHGDTVVLDERAGTITVSGSQHTIVREAEAAPGLGGLVSGSEPTYVSSDRLVVHEAERLALYSGGRPTLRRGDVEVVADELRVDDAAGDFHALGDVESKLRLAEAGSQPAAEGSLFDPHRLIHGRSEELHHDRDASLVRYVGDVTLRQDPSTLTARSVDVHLVPGGGRVDRLVARGDATFTSGPQEAEGEDIEYRAGDARIRVLGGRRPARARDAGGKWIVGGIVEMTVGASDVSVTSPAAGRTRGSLPMEPGGTAPSRPEDGQAPPSRPEAGDGAPRNRTR